MEEPNPRYYRHVELSQFDFTQSDAWEFYKVVKHWSEFNPELVILASDERILRDVKLTELDVPYNIPAQTLLVFHERKIQLKGMYWWLAHNYNDSEKVKTVKSIMTLEEAMKEAVAKENITAICYLANVVDVKPYRETLMRLQQESGQWVLRDGFVDRMMLNQLIAHVFGPENIPDPVLRDQVQKGPAQCLGELLSQPV